MSTAASTMAPTRFAHTARQRRGGLRPRGVPVLQGRSGRASDAPMPRVAVFDLDGTLLDSAYELSPRTAAALKAIADAGVIIVLATGRPVDAVLGQVDGTTPTSSSAPTAELYSFETDHRQHEHFPIELAVLAGRAFRASIPGVRLALFTDVTVHMEDGWLDLVPERPVGVVTVEDAPPRRVGLRCGSVRSTGPAR